MYESTRFVLLISNTVDISYLRPKLNTIVSFCPNLDGDYWTSKVKLKVQLSETLILELRQKNNP